MAKRIRIAIAKCVAICMMLCTTLLWGNAVAYASSNAADITRYCSFDPSSNDSSFRYAVDGNYSTKWSSAKTSSRYIDFTVGSSQQVGGHIFHLVKRAKEMGAVCF